MYQIQRTINQNDCTHFSIASACFVPRLGKGGQQEVAKQESHVETHRAVKRELRVDDEHGLGGGHERTTM